MNTSISTMSTSIIHWLNGFLRARNVDTFQTKPLYQYHMTTDEYFSLRKTLTASLDFGVKNTFSKEWCAAFTLYGSEWFRREYSGDWSWQPIFKSLSFELTAGQIGTIVPKGLTGYWCKPLSKFGSNHNDYLGSMFREGGLPSNLLSSDSNNYKSAFFSVFERYQDAKNLGAEAIDGLIRARISILPETLQGDESVDLIASMVNKLDRLVYQFSLDKQSKPAEYLDAQFPRWRESFPLPLESETGAAFLSQLLSTASTEVRKVAKVRKSLACTHFISFANQSILTVITLPHVCSFDLVKNQLKTSRIELAIFEGEEQIASLGTGFAQFENGMTSVRMRNPVVQVRRHNSDSELYVVAMQAGCKLAEVRLNYSSIDVGESPISLLEKNGKWRILSQTSLTTKHVQVGVLCPNAVITNVEYGELIDTSLAFGDLTLKMLNGQCEFTNAASERYVITTNADSLRADSFILKGEQLPWKSTPALVFKGVPSVIRDDVHSIYEGGNEVSTYLGDRAISSLSQSELNGRQLITAKTSDGLIQLRKHIGVLPKDFEINLINGNKPNQGIIRIKTESPCTWNVVSDHIEVISSKKAPGIKEIWLNANGNPPATVTIFIRANILSEPIAIEVPFPARGAMAYNHNGQPLAKNLTVNDLLGSRLHFFSTQGVPANFQVEAIVRKLGYGKNKQPFYRWNYRVIDKPLEVSLYGLKDAILELLSLSEMLDGEVELSVSGPGKTLNFTINHYSTMLEYDRNGNTVALRSKVLLNAEYVKPVLMSLSAPEQKPLALVSRQSEGVQTGEYELPSFIEKDEPWLIIPDRTSKVSFRAKFFAGCSSSLNDGEVRTLQKAVQLYHPQSNSDVIANVLKQMSSDWTHSGWQYLKNLYKNFGYLPLPTFEVWRHLVRDERVLAVALFVFENDEKFILHLESELPIFWEFIALEHWQYAATLFKDQLSKVGLLDETLHSLVKSNIEKLGIAIPALSDTVVNFLINDSQPKCIPTESMKTMVDNWYQDLLREHSEDNQWPTEYGEELKQWCLHLQLLNFDMNINFGYQAGIVYLPLFAAAKASGRVPGVISEKLPKDAIFHLRKLRDFDRDWFEPMYRCFISYFASQSK